MHLAYVTLFAAVGVNPTLTRAPRLRISNSQTLTITSTFSNLTTMTLNARGMTHAEDPSYGSSPEYHQRPESRTDEPRENQPLLAPPDEDLWKPPRGFIWIQIALMTNVFLNAFDGTITAATYAVISSEFDAANSASWLTTSYLITSTAVQPLYGRVSDIFGRRPLFFTSTVVFALGCLGCGVAGDVITLNFFRALTGVGGGGLMTMGTKHAQHKALVVFLMLTYANL